MIKKFNLFQQEHYVAPALEILIADAAGSLCTGSYGDPGQAGSAYSASEGNIIDYSDEF